MTGARSSDALALRITLDDTHRLGIAVLAENEPLIVTAPSAVVEVTGKPGRPWTLVIFDDFGVRPYFAKAREFAAAHFPGTGELYRRIEQATGAMAAGLSRTATVTFEPRGSKRAPSWTAVGFDLGPAPRVDPSPYSPYADADPRFRHITPIALYGLEPAPGMLAPAACGLMAVVAPGASWLGSDRIEGFCPACLSAARDGTDPEPAGKAHRCPTCALSTRHEGQCALCRQEEHEQWQAAQNGTWLQLSSAPKDGTEVMGLASGDPVPMRWAEERRCMLAGVAPGAGLFGEGWEDTLNYLVIDDVEAWRPMPAAQAGEEA